MKRGLIELQLSLGRPSTKHLLNPSQGLTGTLLGISTFDNGIFYYNSLMETLVQRTFLPFFVYRITNFIRTVRGEVGEMSCQLSAAADSPPVCFSTATVPSLRP